MRGVDHHCDEESGGGGGPKQSFLRGGFAPTTNPAHSFLYTILTDGKGTPFVYLLVINSTPSTYPG